MKKRLRDGLIAALNRKALLLADHIYLCMVMGTEVPLIRMEWDEQKEDLIVEIYGPGIELTRRQRRKTK